MRVRIEQGIDRQEVPGEPRGLFRRPGPPTVYTQPCVDVYIELTEEEKQIVTHNELHSLPLEEFRHHPEDMENALQRERIFMDRFPRGYNQYQREEALTKIRRMYSTPHYTTLEDYLANPYRKRFKTVGDAQTFIDQLKTEILPKLKAAIEARSTPHPTSESFDL